MQRECDEQIIEDSHRGLASPGINFLHKLGVQTPHAADVKNHHSGGFDSDLETLSFSGDCFSLQIPVNQLIHTYINLFKKWVNQVEVISVTAEK